MNITVVDATNGIAGAYATKMFADIGAGVLVVGREPPTTPLFEFLDMGKSFPRSEPALADIVFTDPDIPTTVDALVTVTITAPAQPWSEFTLQAECGSIGMRGRRDQPPVQMGGRISEWITGAFAAPAAFAALRQARITGQPEAVDVSMAECVTLATNLFSDPLMSLLGRPQVPTPARVIEVPSCEEAADGWVGFTLNTRQQYEAFCILIERPDLMADERFAAMSNRLLNEAEWNAIAQPWVRAHTVADVVEQASTLRIPVAPVHNGKTLLDDAHLTAREMFRTHESGFQYPRPPFHFTPSLSHTDWQPKQRIDELRVLDFTSWWAGPTVGHFFSCLGADVIHLESIQRMDGMRTTSGTLFPTKEWWEYSSFFLSFNTNKRDLTLDLNHERGRHVAVELIKTCDVVVENYAPRVLEQFGLDWDAVHAINPHAVLVRMPGWGLTGPWRDRTSFAQTCEQFSGLAWSTGYPDDCPRVPRGPGDPVGGMTAAFATLAALATRDITNEGLMVEVPLVEATLCIAAEQVIEWSAHGNLLTRMGNQSPHAVFQDLLPCRGAEQWLAVTCVTDEQLQIVRALGPTDELDVEETAAYLRTLGVPAAPVADPRIVSKHPSVTRLFETVDHPVVGTHRFPTLPFRFASIAQWNRTPAPTLGQHNHEILTELGLSPADIEALERDHVIGTRPVGL